MSSPEELSGLMMRRKKYNLNLISHDRYERATDSPHTHTHVASLLTAAFPRLSCISLIRDTLDKGVNVKEIYVDTVGDPAKYQEKLSTVFPGIKVVVAKKADAIYPVVSAASICAKVTRDWIVNNWKFAENFTESNMPSKIFGSGYPGDPKTRAWLPASFDPVFGFPSLVRFSWAPSKKFIEANCVAAEWEESDDEDEDEAAAKKKGKKKKKERDQPTLSFAKKPPKRAKYFAERNLTVVTMI